MERKIRLAMAELKEGFYWVRYNGKWDIAKMVKSAQHDYWYFSDMFLPQVQTDKLEEIGTYLGTEPPKQPELREDWNKVVDGSIYVPDDLDPLINKLGMQLRFHTISGKGEVETLARMTRIAEEFFHKKYKEEWQIVVDRRRTKSRRINQRTLE